MGREKIISMFSWVYNGLEIMDANPGLTQHKARLTGSFQFKKFGL
jgi:hypothetical protein